MRTFVCQYFFRFLSLNPSSKVNGIATKFFSRRIPVKYKTIIIDKKYTDNSRILKQKISLEINKMIKENKHYFNKFDRIVMYYDNGQEVLGTILDSIFLQFDGFEHRIDFDHKEKRLFQVSDMLTYIDKYDYKYKNKMTFTKGEKYFFSINEIRKIEILTIKKATMKVAPLSSAWRQHGFDPMN